MDMEKADGVTFSRIWQNQQYSSNRSFSCVRPRVAI